MVKRSLTLVLFLFGAVLLMAMGGKGGGFDRAPRVDKNFSVTVTDVTGHKIEGEKFSCEGRTRLSGTMGMAEVNLPFERITEVKMGDKRNRKVKVSARLADGSETSLEMDSDARCFGEADFGSFMLPVDEIGSILFKGVK